MPHRFADEELRVMRGVISGLPLSKLGASANATFHNAMSKLRNSIGYCQGVPLEGDPTAYSLGWFKSNPQEALALVERYDHACRESWRVYFAIRCGTFEG